VDVSEPGRGLAGGLTLPILRALSTRSTPATAAQVERVTGEGTAAGIRRALERLADHGVCLRDEVGGRVVYSLNRDHILYSAVEALLHSDRALQSRLRTTLRGWDRAPRAAVLFGSAARKDGGPGSDIDLLLIRPDLAPAATKRDWADQVQELRSDVSRWTGNRLQVLDWTLTELRRHASRQEPLISELLDDGVTLAGATLHELLGRAP